eukprot:gene17892-24284_t
MSVDKEWLTQFKAAVADLPTSLGFNATYDAASRRLRELVKGGLLKHTDVKDAPERFFAAHRTLSALATAMGPGFGIRFTVQFNLFAGTVAALGKEQHLAWLDEMQQRGQLGCFALTERLAGVNSGLVVETNCTWDPISQTFNLHTPYSGACKNWISQGCVADCAVVIANLVVDEKSLGPHAFMMQLRKLSGQLVPGVTIGDMGVKTIGNDLDNAWIQFDNVRLPKSAMLNRYVDITADNKYVQLMKGVPNIDMIGQRLYTGRIVIAESAVVFAKTLFSTTKAYSDTKKCWAPGGARPSLSQIPQLKALYVEAEQRLQYLDHFIYLLKERITPILRDGGVPPKSIVDAIACAKVSCIETTIELCHRLKQEVGSFALMAGTGFERMDYLQCCKFAEGDSRILMQKLARDRVASLRKAAPRPQPAQEISQVPCSSQEASKEVALSMKLAVALKTGGLPAWDEHWEDVYDLARMVVDRTMAEFLASAPTQSRL